MADVRAWITGGTGFVGSNVIAEHLAAGDVVHCAAHRSVPPEQLGVTWRRVDLLDGVAVRADVERVAPDVVVHCAIRNDLASLTTDRRGAWADYVDATRSVVDAANAAGCQVILVSTDWVFDGTRPRADEAEPPRPVNTYGLLKFAQERVVVERAERGAVARIAGVNGVHRWGETLPREQDVGFGYFVSSLVHRLQNGSPFTVWQSDDINMVATPSLASESAGLMRRIGALGATGIFHCCGSDALTRRELAELTCDVFGLDPGLLRYDAPPRQAIPGEPVPRDTSLDATATARQLGVELTGARDLLVGLRDELSRTGSEPAA